MSLPLVRELRLGAIRQGLQSGGPECINIGLNDVIRE